jgi:hypothetical protein
LSSSLRSSLSAFAMASDMMLALMELAMAVMNGESMSNAICGPPDLCRRLGGPRSENPLANMAPSRWTRLRPRLYSHQRQPSPLHQRLLQPVPVYSRCWTDHIYSARQAGTKDRLANAARLHPPPCSGAHVNQHEAVGQDL